MRAWNDEPYGEGGWYDGPIMLTGTGTMAGVTDSGDDANTDDKNTEGEMDEDVGKDKQAEGVKEYFYEETFKSELIKEGKYLIYLPHDYYGTERLFARDTDKRKQLPL